MTGDDKGMQNNTFWELLRSGKIEENLKKSMETFAAVFEAYNRIDLEKIADSLNRLAEAFSSLPNDIQEATKKWASYGWIPSLPQCNVYDYVENLSAPESKDEADKILLTKIDEETFNRLTDSISEHIPQYGQNQKTFSESMECYNKSLYSACALLLFSMIDSIFVNSQKKPDNLKERRALAKNAVGKVIDKEKSQYSIIAQATKLIIKDYLFKDPIDFSNENGLNRNMLSHGMNKYNPNKTDCLKLFVLIYNIYLLFDTVFFTWESGMKENNDEDMNLKPY